MEKVQTGRHENLPAAEFQSRLRQEPLAVLLDVRTPGEFSCGCIPSALNMDIMDNGFYDALAGLDKTKTYFVYCQKGGRSRQACLIMAEQGFTVYNLIGGMGDWPGNTVTP